MSTSLVTSPTRTFDRLDQFMEEVLGERFHLKPWMGWTPAVDIKETDKDYTFVCELPGFKKEDVNVELSNDVLTVYGRREKIKDEKTENFVRTERQYGEFKRSFKMDTHVRPDSIMASFKDGLLTIVVPKIEAVKPTKIEVRA
jgi:HSP20 family protein